MVAGSTLYNDINSTLILKLNVEGNIVWEKIVGENTYVESVQTTNDGGFVVTGQEYLALSGQRLWLMKLD